MTFGLKKMNGEFVNGFGDNILWLLLSLNKNQPKQCHKGLKVWISGFYLEETKTPVFFGRFYCT